MAEKKIAILIGNTEFPDAQGKLAPIPSSRNDVLELQKVLNGHEQGWFTDTVPMIDLPHHKIMLSINQIFRAASRDDQILLYYSGRGQLDSAGMIHFATINTNPDWLHATSLPAETLIAMLRETRCRRVSLVLDCCISGADGKPDSEVMDGFEQDVQLLKTSITDGYAISVLSASSYMDTALNAKHDQLGSLTKHIINGIQSGNADQNDDGLITMDELFAYVEKQVVAENQPKPMYFQSGLSSGLVISCRNGKLITPDLITQIKNKLENAIANEEINSSVYDDAISVLEKDAAIIKDVHESSFRLLKLWLLDSMTTAELAEQWYQYHETGLPDASSKALSTSIKDRWEVVRACRKPIMDLVSPTYILDRNFQFLDWNPMFDELIAKPLALMRGRHVEEFILELANKHDVIKRATETFLPDQYPIVDTENLLLKTKYGLVKFRKIASQIADDEGGALAWAVNLNILSAENEEQLWHDLGDRLKREVNWSIYAKSYDQMLLKFDGYHQLIEKLVDLVGDRGTNILDLGSGTGNVTMKLLSQKGVQNIWALESNEDMLEFMRKKINGLNSEDEGQVNILKGDMLLSLREFEDESFDSAIMMNALYAMDDRMRCLQEIFRVLKPNGVLVYSSSTQETDIERLFAAIRNNLEAKGCLENMRSIVDSAYDRHVEMQRLILKDSHEDLLNYARSAGFTVAEQDIEKGAYEGAVTIVKAIKTVYVVPRVETEPVAQIDDDSIRVFISYSHKDDKWCQRIKDYLSPLSIDVWTDHDIQLGEKWRDQIQHQLERSNVAILLVSTNFLNSEFIENNELPSLLHSAMKKGLLIVPVILEQCMYEYVTYKYPDPKTGPEEFNLSELQSACKPTEAMDALDKAIQNSILYEIAKRIIALKK